LPVPVAAGPTDAEEIIAKLVTARIKAKRTEREKHLSDTDRMLASMRSPTLEEFDAE
jgi:hypothetical protein